MRHGGGVHSPRTTGLDARSHSDAKDALEPLRPAQRCSGRMGGALGGVSRVGGDGITARPHAPRHLATDTPRFDILVPMGDLGV